MQQTTLSMYVSLLFVIFVHDSISSPIHCMTTLFSGGGLFSLPLTKKRTLKAQKNHWAYIIMAMTHDR